MINVIINVLNKTSKYPSTFSALKGKVMKYIYKRVYGFVKIVFSMNRPHADEPWINRLISMFRQ